MNPRFFRIFATFMLAIAAITMISLPNDAEARRMGGARSFGKQSQNIFKQRKAVKPPAANTQQRASNSASNKSNAAGNAPKSGMSRFMGPLAGIAAGLGIAALLSAFGLSGAFLEFMSTLILIAIAIFAIRFIINRLRGGSPSLATQNANSGTQANNVQNMFRQSQEQSPSQSSANFNSGGVASSNAGAASPQGATAFGAENTEPVDESWFIPENFDTVGFLGNAKQQFISIQALWDKGNTEELRNYLTDDLLIEITADLQNRTGENITEVVLLNAELMGIEKVAGGHLASVRYSGMLREAPNTEAQHFEEVWNLYKEDNAGWLVAGIQQINS